MAATTSWAALLPATLTVYMAVASTYTPEGANDADVLIACNEPCLTHRYLWNLQARADGGGGAKEDAPLAAGRDQCSRLRHKTVV